MKNAREEKKKKEKGSSNASSNLESMFNQTLRSVQELLLGSSFPGKVLISRKSEPSSELTSPVHHQNFGRSYSENDIGPSKRANNSSEEELQSSGNMTRSAEFQKLKISMTNSERKLSDALRSASGARAVDSARITKFTKALSGSSVILEKLRELAWNGVPPDMRPSIWRLLLGYASPNPDRRERLLTRKRLEYVDCVSQYCDIPETERSDDEINMLRQIAVDCPRTVPDVTFFQQEQVQKSLERILYTWNFYGKARAIRHPASGYVQGINDLVTPFLMVFLSEHLDGGMESWSVSDLSPQKISNVEADCYWCLSKLLDGMQDHYTFAQPGIQRLIFKLKELVHRIDGTSIFIGYLLLCLFFAKKFCPMLFHNFGIITCI
ncbi:GTPase-activating protein gyp1 [Cocos nucifera]|nr:GTPase-activating protein gyp1 [Cocos nucifera]